MTDALAAAAAKVQARYLPKNDSHAAEWAPAEEGGHYIGVSTLVKRPAGEYSRRIAERIWDEADDELRYYTFRGVSLGDAALADVPSREIEIEVPLRDGWVLRGHADGVESFDGRVVVYEHKSHQAVNQTNVDMAFRQGAAYLALMEMAAAVDPTFRERGIVPPIVHFPVAKWCKDDTSCDFIWKDNFQPAGVLVAVAPFNPPAAIKQFPMEADAIRQVCDFYFAKAHAVLDSALSGDHTAADKWDADHPTEFLVPFAQIDAGIPELEDIGAQLAEQLRIVTPQGIDPEVLDGAEKEVARLRKLALLAMQKHDIKAGTFGGVALTRVDVKGREVPATTAGWKEPYSYVRSRLAVA